MRCEIRIYSCGDVHAFNLIRGRQYTFSNHDILKSPDPHCQIRNCFRGGYCGMLYASKLHKGEGEAKYSKDQSRDACGGILMSGRKGVAMCFREGGDRNAEYNDGRVREPFDHAAPIPRNASCTSGSPIRFFATPLSTTRPVWRT